MLKKQAIHFPLPLFQGYKWDRRLVHYLKSTRQGGIFDFFYVHLEQELMFDAMY